MGDATVRSSHRKEDEGKGQEELKEGHLGCFVLAFELEVDVCVLILW